MVVRVRCSSPRALAGFAGQTSLTVASAIVAPKPLHSGVGHSKARRRIVPLVMFIVYLTGGVVALWHVWANGPSDVVVGGGGGDPAQYTWFLRWALWCVTHWHNPFITHRANYPFGVNLVANTSMLALGLIAAPVTAVWGPITSLNLLWTLAFPLSAAAAYTFIRRLTAGAMSAFVGGLIYGFSPYMVGQGLGHLDLVFVPLPPLIFLALYELVIAQRRPPVRWGCLLAVFVTLQFFISSEVLASTALFSCIALAVIALVWRRLDRHRLAHASRGLSVACVITAGILAFPVAEFETGSQHIVGIIPGFRYYYSTLLAPLLPTKLMMFGSARLKALGDRIAGSDVAENGSYLGAPLVAVIVLAPLVVRTRVAITGTALAVIAFVLSLGTTLHVGTGGSSGGSVHVHLPGSLLYHVPILKDGFPLRYSLFVAFFGSIVVAHVLDRAAERIRNLQGLHASRVGIAKRQFGAAAVACLLAAIVLIPLVPAWPYPGQEPVSVPRFYTTAAARTIPVGSVVLIYPFPTNLYTQGEEWQAEAGLRFRIVGGYFLVPDRSGRGSQFFTRDLVEETMSALMAGKPPVRTAALRAGLRSELASWKVRTILVQPIGSDPVGFFTWLTGRPSSHTVDGTVVWSLRSWPRSGRPSGHKPSSRRLFGLG